MFLRRVTKIQAKVGNFASVTVVPECVTPESKQEKQNWKINPKNQTSSVHQTKLEQKERD